MPDFQPGALLVGEIRELVGDGGGEGGHDDDESDYSNVEMAMQEREDFIEMVGLCCLIKQARRSQLAIYSRHTIPGPAHDVHERVGGETGPTNVVS